MTRRLYFAGLVAALTALAPSAAQEHETPDGPAGLMGAWTAPCDAWGTSATCQLDWSRGLHDALLSVRYQIRAENDGSRIFEGEGVYRVGDGDRLDGYWSDSGGAVHPLAARWSDGVLTTHWGVPGGVLGRTRYALSDDGTLTVTDWQLVEEGWRAFMTVRYSRQD